MIDVDAGIAPVVRSLLISGFETTASCSGRSTDHDWRHPEARVPFVNVAAPRRKLSSVRDRLLSWATNRDLLVNVCVVYGNYADPRTGAAVRPFLRLEFFDNLPEPSALGQAFPADVCICGCPGYDHESRWEDGEFKGTRCLDRAHGGHKFARIEVRK